ncbi:MULTISPECIES: cysteine hydrolase family protein [Sorangium]|uniref:Isochorismatase n=1 Tax=Sorangium cellulosum (strain So ce56) TaxID=448385 RepID=A9FEV9_SORC5|nr:isochorismatase family protein [Sorangium cellulosum]CAN94928.1 putative isochorismatase [Sorangium cellulosum So ce56]
MLTQARGRTGVALLFFILVSALTAERLAALPPAAGEATTLRRLYGLGQVDRLHPERTALVLVDFQEEFFSGGLKLPGGRAALENAARLLRWARESGITVAHVRNVGANGARLFAADGPRVDFAPAARPLAGELVITKSMAGGFTKTELDDQLRRRGVDTIIVSGLMTHLAVDSTVRDGLVLGYRVLLPSDASASRDLPAVEGAQGARVLDHRTVHEVSLAALADRFADVLPTEGVLALPLHDAAR